MPKASRIAHVMLLKPLSPLDGGVQGAAMWITNNTHHDDQLTRKVAQLLFHIGESYEFDGGPHNALMHAAIRVAFNAVLDLREDRRMQNHLEDLRRQLGARPMDTES